MTRRERLEPGVTFTSYSILAIFLMRGRINWRIRQGIKRAIVVLA
jgi:hypothetical protein